MAETIQTTNTQTNGITASVAQVTGVPTPVDGSVGLDSQMPGSATTVSRASAPADPITNKAGIAPGNFIETDIDQELFRFKSDDTPLMDLMLNAKKVTVNSPVVEHYMIDEPKANITVTTAYTESSSVQNAVLTVANGDNKVCRPYTTLVCHGVNGYYHNGTTNVSDGRPLMLFVVGEDAATGKPIVRAVNGKKANASDEHCYVPTIAAGTVCTVLGNALYETQKEVDPDLIIPVPELVYLQKRGMNQVVSDYFDSQKKRIPFSKSIIAEQAIANFKTRGNRTLWAGRKGKLKVNVPKMGPQDVYFTEGVRWQIKREYQHSGTWTFEKLIALAKMFFTGEDVPKTAILLAGKNLLEELQCIDFTKHNEVNISVKTNPLGWEVTNIHTVFGDIQIKREPTLDRLGWSNSGALLGEDRLVHYQRTTEHTFNDKVEGEEATRSGIIVWDALALKGCCHIWIDGEETSEGDAVVIKMWDGANAPTGADLTAGEVYYFLKDYTVPSGNSTMKVQNGSMWKVTAKSGAGTEASPYSITWAPYDGVVF